MNVLFISQCNKRALTETRRILDQFAERRGERTWQTPITQAGLDTVRRLLRKTARKNTAVACHWIRGQDHSELMWVVGDASQFSAQGACPTDTTTRNILRSQDENNWHTGEDIRLLAALAALLHDLGKASEAFQSKLKSSKAERNVFRHEWVSLRLFQAFVGPEAKDDLDWLQRLANPSPEDAACWIADDRYQKDGLDATNAYPFRHLPPLASAISWLIVSHHRLPVIPVKNDGVQARIGTPHIGSIAAWLNKPLEQVTHNSNERSNANPKQIKAYWLMADDLPITRTEWQTQAARLAKRLLERHPSGQKEWLDNPYVMHLARLSLMLADHHYSSLPKQSAERINLNNPGKLYANTDHDKTLKQTLDEHLLGVARDASQIAHALPGFERYLPRLVNHRGLRKRSGHPRFSWQDKAADAAAALRPNAHEQGAFIVNMASTGCGKTLANARILYALADPQLGLRASYALGLRTLTLQTGHSYRTDLHLGEDDLAILVGGSANRSLFEYYEQLSESHGSASIQELLEEDSYVRYEGVTSDHPLLSRALHDPAIKKLVSAPMLVCTVDHLVPATESLRAGRQIAPMLRLMSSDLVLDELDDYQLEDLPALTRLVYWAGLLGTRIILSSATLPPALVEGMFQAYRQGRAHYRNNRSILQNTAALEIPCLWVDEFTVHAKRCGNAEAFTGEHGEFVKKRTDHLKKNTPLRRGELIPLEMAKNQASEKNHSDFALHVRAACLRLHQDHAETDPVSGKRISFGLVRMANIEPLFDVAKNLFELGAPEGTHIHLCVYHARFPLLQRSAIEHLLDSALNRRDPQAVYHLPEIRSLIDAHKESEQLFVVLASPVCEVGRDWDADWAVAEPSSMRALIQLAGRVQRHRAKACDKPNILIFDTNLRHFRGEKGRDEKPAAIFLQPGFEKNAPVLNEHGEPNPRLRSHFLSKLLRPKEFEIISAIPRILPEIQDVQPNLRLADLEQTRIADTMLPQPEAQAGREPNAACIWQFPQLALTGVLPQQQPFRDNSMRTETLVFLPDEEGEDLIVHRLEQDPDQRGKELYVNDRRRIHDIPLVCGSGIGPWHAFKLLQLIMDQAEYLEQELSDCAQRFTVVEVLKNDQGWRHHPWLGLAKK